MGVLCAQPTIRLAEPPGWQFSLLDGNLVPSTPFEPSLGWWRDERVFPTTRQPLPPTTRRAPTMPTGTIPGATNTRRHPDADASLDKTVRFEPTADLRATSGDFFFFLATSLRHPALPLPLSLFLSLSPCLASLARSLAPSRPSPPLHSAVLLFAAPHLNLTSP